MSKDIAHAKEKFPLPILLSHYGLDTYAKSISPSPFRDGDNKTCFGIFQRDGIWFWKDQVTGAGGDEINFIETYEGVSRGEAIKKYLSLAGVSNDKNYKSTTQYNKPPSVAQIKDKPPSKPFDWQACLDALTPDYIKQIAEWRGVGQKTVEALQQKGLIGIYQGTVAFPVFDDDYKNVVGVHSRLKNGEWRYFPAGLSQTPLIFGELENASQALIFESQWDAIAVADKIGLTSMPMLITRGASNGAKVSAYIEDDTNIVLFPQHDKPPKNGGVKPCDQWRDAIIKSAESNEISIVDFPEEHKDANDWIKAGASSDEVSSAILSAKKIRKSTLSIRTIGEILSMTFDDADNYFGDRILAKGQPMTFLGPGGVGKSRMLLQMALSMVTGRDFLDFPTHAKGKRWLFLQTENNNRRLFSDLKKMLVNLMFEPDELQTINSTVFFHTLEKPEDLFLDLNDQNDFRNTQHLIAECKPDFVVFDPLNTFTSGDLNSDKDMRDVVSQITKATKAVNQDIVPIIVHHSLTGKAGASKSTGWDRSSYGRNSKVLYAWTRSQINISLRDPEDDTQLVFSCGKNNNGSRFADTGVKFNPFKWLYYIDHTFSADEYQDELNSTTKRKQQ